MSDPGEPGKDGGLRRAGLLALGLVVVFAVVAAVADAVGAANLGTALGFGQIGFAAALVYALLRL